MSRIDYQDPYHFFDQVREYVDYIHIKDAVLEDDAVRYVFPGHGGGRVREILRASAGGRRVVPISIEPHVAVVFHDPSVTASFEDRWNTFIDYGWQVAAGTEGWNNIQPKFYVAAYDEARSLVVDWAKPM